MVFLLDRIIPHVWERIKLLLVGRRGQRIHFTILFKSALSVNHLLGTKTLQRRKTEENGLVLGTKVEVRLEDSTPSGTA